MPKSCPATQPLSHSRAGCAQRLTHPSRGALGVPLDTSQTRPPGDPKVSDPSLRVPRRLAVSLPPRLRLGNWGPGLAQASPNAHPPQGRRGRDSGPLSLLAPAWAPFPAAPPFPRPGARVLSPWHGSPGASRALPRAGCDAGVEQNAAHRAQSHLRASSAHHARAGRPPPESLGSWNTDPGWRIRFWHT